MFRIILVSLVLHGVFLFCSANASPSNLYVDYLSDHRIYCIVSKKKIIETKSIDECENRNAGEAFDSEKEAKKVLAKSRGNASSNDAAGHELIGSGTGFVVSSTYVVTANHVIDECDSLQIRHAHSDYAVNVAATDAKNDLAILKLEGSIQASAKIRDGKALQLGETIVVFGYPLSGLLSKSANISQGNVNSLAGLGNDASIIQYDASSQPGNSGGPLLDSAGNVVGVISSGLNKRYADLTGHIPQNVNFAIKSNLLEGFLASNGVRYELADSIRSYSLVDLAPVADRFTVFVGCYG